METIPIPGAEIYYDKNFLSPQEATILFDILRTKFSFPRLVHVRQTLPLVRK